MMRQICFKIHGLTAKTISFSNCHFSYPSFRLRLKLALPFLRLSDRFGQFKRSVAVALLVGASGCAWAPGAYLVHRPGASDQFEFIDLNRASVDQLEKISERPGVEGVSIDDLFEVKPAPYRLGVGDTISFSYWGLPEFMPSGPITQPGAAAPLVSGGTTVAGSAGHIIENDGTIFLPYVGMVKVAGLTIAQARDTIAEKMAVVVKDPQFDFRVVGYASQKVVVSGQVRQPGAVFITNQPLDLMTAIGRAGGFNPDGDTQTVLIFRDNKRISVDLDVIIAKGLNPATIYLKEGDLIQVEDRRLTRRAYVTGEVLRNFPVSVTVRYSLADAIADAGGAQQLSSNGDFYVIRPGDQKPTVYYLSLESPKGASVATKMMLKPGDVVYAGVADLARFNRVISSLFPGLGAVRQVQDIDYYRLRR